MSKCWKAIERFSEDIDLSIHWADLAEEKDEAAAWEKSTQSKSQSSKFRKLQTQRLTEWSTAFVDTLNKRFEQYGISELKAELEEGSNGEKIDIHFPRLTANSNAYQLDHVLLEFGGRNRGRPTVKHDVSCYLSEVTDLQAIGFPVAEVEAYDPGYILWEKLTALHQFSTQEKDPNPVRLARHWYDVDCLLQQTDFSNPLGAEQAMHDVVAMKTERWAQKGVDFEQVLNGELKLIPDSSRLAGIAEDHQTAIDGGMFFNTPDDFSTIVDRLNKTQESINEALSQQ